MGRIIRTCGARWISVAAWLSLVALLGTAIGATVGPGAGEKTGRLPAADKGSPARDERDGAYPCTSRPSAVRELAFSQRGTIAETSLRIGDTVKVGQELARMEDSVQRAQVRLAELAASDTSPVDQAQSTLSFREEELRLVAQANSASAAGSPADLREARYRRDAAVIELAAAKHKAKSDALMLVREQARLDEMRILSPINGTVVLVNKHGGEGATEGMPVVTLVSIDPLWVDVSVPTRSASSLAVGETAVVEWEDIEGVGAMHGKVIYVAPAADAARVVQVRVEIGNPNRVPAGLHGTVRFPRALGGSGAAAGGAGEPSGVSK